MRDSRKPGETFYAEPLIFEESWRVRSSWGAVEFFRVHKDTADLLVEALNSLPEDPHSRL